MKKKMIIGLLAAALFTLGAHSAAAQNNTDTFMLVPGIPGESVQVGRNGWIDVFSVSQSFNGAQKGDGGACTVAVTKGLDRSGPLLWAAAVTGQVFNEIVIEIARSQEGKAPPFYVLTLSNVFVSAISSSPTDLAEHLTLTVTSATLTYTMQNPDGSAGQKVSSTVKCK